MAQVTANSVNLARFNINKEKLLILDLDECLIHSEFTEIFRNKRDAKLAKVRGTGFWMDIEDDKQCWVSTDFIRIEF